MNHLLRLLWLRLTVSRRSRLQVTDVCVTPMRVRLSDLDVLRHMNNGACLTALDHARQELVVRTGLWKRMRDAGMYPVVGAQTIAYRKSLTFGQRYVIESRFLGLDDRAAYLEQRFVVDGEVYARAYVQGRFLYDAGGTVPMDEVSSYGVVARGAGPDQGFAVTGMVEKPKQEDAPSNLIISGRYILQPEIFNLLADQPRGAGGEIQLTDAMQTLMRQQSFTGVKYTGRSFDCGSKIGFLTANVVYALDRPDIAGPFVREIRAALSASDGK